MAQLTKSELKLLAVIKERPGLLWYEVGAFVYPNSTRQRQNISGGYFMDLVGSGMNATYKGVRSLSDQGFIRGDKDFKLYAVEPAP